MLFNSFGFIFLFLPTVFFGFFWIAKTSHRLAALWLAVASLFFYGWWNPKFVLLLLGSITFNYALGYAIGHARGQARLLLVSAITSNLLLLGVFKYANFFIATTNQFGAGFGVGFGVEFGALDIILPLGVSFFTFTQIAFLVDVYRGIAREYNFIHYLLFVTWFPHLIAGPVLHHKQMMPQFAQPNVYRRDTEAIAVGLTMFALGLFKKVVLADQFALYATPVFDGAANGAQPMLIEAWLGALAYTLQLYFDFSGYSDMAIGLSRLFNIRLPLNFNSPYKATNIIDFWRRWHMSLSAFLRDYLYIPLGGSRHGRLSRYRNLMATMLLGGLWHGAGWNFVLWGGLHGLFLVINHGWRALTGAVAASSGRVARVFGALLTFAAVTVAWVFFRAASMDAATRILAGMAGQNGISLPARFAPLLAPHVAGNHSIFFNGFAPLTGSGASPFLWLAGGLFIVWILPNSQQWLARYSPAWDAADNGRLAGWLAWRPSKLTAVIAGLVFGFTLLNLTKASQFLYFQF